jgi:hypothetical protein
LNEEIRNAQKATKETTPAVLRTEKGRTEKPEPGRQRHALFLSTSILCHDFVPMILRPLLSCLPAFLIQNLPVLENQMDSSARPSGTGVPPVPEAPATRQGATRSYPLDFPGTGWLSCAAALRQGKRHVQTGLQQN